MYPLLSRSWNVGILQLTGKQSLNDWCVLVTTWLPNRPSKFARQVKAFYSSSLNKHYVHITKVMIRWLLCRRKALKYCWTANASIILGFVLCGFFVCFNSGKREPKESVFLLTLNWSVLHALQWIRNLLGGLSRESRPLQVFYMGTELPSVWARHGRACLGRLLCS